MKRTGAGHAGHEGHARPLMAAAVAASLALVPNALAGTCGATTEITVECQGDKERPADAEAKAKAGEAATGAPQIRRTAVGRMPATADATAAACDAALLAALTALLVGAASRDGPAGPTTHDQPDA